jgi:hypothetical protein
VLGASFAKDFFFEVGDARLQLDVLHATQLGFDLRVEGDDLSSSMIWWMARVFVCDCSCVRFEELKGHLLR